MKLRIMLMAVAGLAAAMMAGEVPAQTSASARQQATGSDVAPSVRNRAVPEKYRRRMVRFSTNEAPGTIIVDTNNKFLYYVEGRTRAAVGQLEHRQRPG